MVVRHSWPEISGFKKLLKSLLYQYFSVVFKHFFLSIDVRKAIPENRWSAMALHTSCAAVLWKCDTALKIFNKFGKLQGKWEIQAWKYVFRTSSRTERSQNESSSVPEVASPMKGQGLDTVLKEKVPSFMIESGGPPKSEGSVSWNYALLS